MLFLIINRTFYKVRLFFVLLKPILRLSRINLIDIKAKEELRWA